MYRFARDEDVDLDELRLRLRRMSDENLLRFGRAARFMCSDKSPRKVFVVQLGRSTSRVETRGPFCHREEPASKGDVFTMKNLYEASTVEQVKERITRLRPGSERQWGKMNAAQAVAHCSVAMEWAVGDSRPPRMFLGRILGPMVKSKVLGDEKPMAWCRRGALGSSSPAAEKWTTSG